MGIARSGLGTNMGISNWYPNNAILVAIVGGNQLGGQSNSSYIRRRSWGIHIRAVLKVRDRASMEVLYSLRRVEAAGLHEAHLWSDQDAMSTGTTVHQIPPEERLSGLPARGRYGIDAFFRI